MKTKEKQGVIDIKNDLRFKYMIGKDEYLLKLFIENIITNYKVNGEIILLRTELDTNSMYESNKMVDLLVKIGNDDYIDIEMNNRNSNILKYRNFMYITKIYNRYMDFDNEECYGNFYLINLNNFKEDTDNKEVYVYGNNLTNVYIKNLKIINIDIDKYYKRFYNGDESLKTRLIAMLNAKNEEELSYILGNAIDKERKEIIMHNYSIYNTDEVFDKSDINLKCNKYIEEEWREEDRKEARRIGLNEGRREGRKEEKHSNIINSLKNGVDIKLVAKIFNISISEIEKIKNSII